MDNETTMPALLTRPAPLQEKLPPPVEPGLKWVVLAAAGVFVLILATLVIVR